MVNDYFWSMINDQIIPCFKFQVILDMSKKMDRIDIEKSLYEKQSF